MFPSTIPMEFGVRALSSPRIPLGKDRDQSPSIPFPVFPTLLLPTCREGPGGAGRCPVPPCPVPGAVRGQRSLKGSRGRRAELSPLLGTSPGSSPALRGVPAFLAQQFPVPVPSPLPEQLFPEPGAAFQGAECPFPVARPLVAAGGDPAASLRGLRRDLCSCRGCFGATSAQFG